MPPVGRVAELWRYPVKSMGGQRVDQAVLGPRGVRTDRLWAVRDLGTDVLATARRLPGLLTCEARFDGEPAADVGPGRPWPVVVTFPDGEELRSDDARVHARLGELLGRRVRLVPLAPLGDRRAHRAGLQTPASVRRDLGLDRDDRLPARPAIPLRTLLRLARYATPPGSHVDVFPVHLLSTTTLATLAAETSGSPGSPDSPVDVRRFRPNVVLELVGDADGSDPGLPEHGWSGGTLRLGGARLDVVTPTVRCVVPTRPQPGLPLDRELMRAVARRADRFAGAYAEVAAAGTVREGDEVTLAPGRPPGVVRRAADRALAAVLQQTVRLGS
ncbi:MOSC domain-containing protein [Nocardioides aurantiacus]|uniref:MOSC domain-containing protein n=1 Tax=Nocardioides aurantiacus TaxID=86796 RepID=UPI00403F252E